MSSSRYSWFFLPVRVVGAVVILAIFFLGFLRINDDYRPIRAASHGTEQIEAPKLESNVAKVSSKAFQILEPTAPLDRVDVALPSSPPRKPIIRPDVPLVTYVYFETPWARVNIQFFVRHGLHAAADFIFIFNGDTDADKFIPKDTPNIKIIRRKNTCFDLGTHWEVLTARKRGEKALRDTYKKFILMNGSIRGPFMPPWSRECWTDAYLNRVNDKVKLVGSTINCMGGNRQHVQSMIWATDSIGLNLMLTPAGIGQCFNTLLEAVGGEIRTTPLMKSAGYHVDVMMTLFQSERDYAFENCTHNGDMLYEGTYAGFNVHPFELIFIKTHRGINPLMIDTMSEWVDKSGYSSYDVCGGREEMRRSTSVF